MVTVKLKDPKKICWDRETGRVITGPDSVTVEDTKFIRDKIEEGALVEVPEEESLPEPEPEVEPEAAEPTEEAAKPAEAKPAEKPKKKK